MYKHTYTYIEITISSFQQMFTLPPLNLTNNRTIRDVQNLLALNLSHLSYVYLNSNL